MTNERFHQAVSETLQEQTTADQPDERSDPQPYETSPGEHPADTEQRWETDAALSAPPGLLSPSSTRMVTADLERAADRLSVVAGAAAEAAELLLRAGYVARGAEVLEPGSSPQRWLLDGQARWQQRAEEARAVEASLRARIEELEARFAADE